MSNKTTVIIGIVAIVVIAGASWYLLSRSNNESAGSLGSGRSPVLSANPGAGQATSTPTSTPASALHGSSSSNIAYNAALKKYVYRIQFSSCHGDPGTLAIRQGDQFMLDNRDNATDTIRIQSQTYILKPYSFAIATASTLGKYNITCDGGGTAQLDVQK